MNARNLADGGFRAITGFARQVPAVTLRYGGFDQLQGTADVLARFLLDGGLDAAAGRRFLSLFAPGPPPTELIVAPSSAVPAPKKYQIPAPTPRREPKKLTVGMATYDDYYGVYFSLQALRLYHPEILDATNFLVVDNHPDGPCSEGLKAWRAPLHTIATFHSIPTRARRYATASSQRRTDNSFSAWTVMCSSFPVP